MNTIWCGANAGKWTNLFINILVNLRKIHFYVHLLGLTIKQVKLKYYIIFVNKPWHELNFNNI